MRYWIISAFHAAAYDHALNDPEDICETAKKADLRSEKRLRNQVEEKVGNIAGVRLGLYWTRVGSFGPSSLERGNDFTSQSTMKR
jgi:hypothetical protein